MNKYLTVFRSQYGENLIMMAYNELMNYWPLPYQDIYIESKLGTTHVIVSGPDNGRPVFLIHAFYASAASWYQNVKQLSVNHRVYSVDIIGDPNKSKPLQPIRKALFYVDWLKDLMDQLHIENAVFIGNSVGAFHVANFALNEPERVSSMILIGPAATFVSIPKFYLNTFPGGMTGWELPVKHAVSWIENGSPFEPKFRELFYLLLKHGKSVNQVFPAILTDGQLSQIQIPTLLIYGEKEVIYDYNLAIRRAEKYMQKIKIEIIPCANHITGASRPDLTNRVILKFLEPG